MGQVGDPAAGLAEGPENLLLYTARRAKVYVKELRYLLLGVVACLAVLAGREGAAVPGYTGYVLGAALAFLVLAFFCDTLPQRRARGRIERIRDWVVEGKETRPGYFRIFPYEDTSEDRERYSRPDAAPEQVRHWIERSAEPILFFTGASGTGKTSLLNACVIPRLRVASPPFRTLALRSFDDPVRALRASLLEPDVVWQQPPAKAAEPEPGERVRETLRLLQSAAKHLAQNNERLLVVFDQFEELLIIHGTDPDRVKPASELLHSLLAERIPQVTVLLSLRSDYQNMLVQLGLPPLVQNANWRALDPFTERASRDFLTQSGLAIPPKRLESVLTEAAAVDGARGLIRPITLNMLGMLLSRMSGDLPRAGEPGSLLIRDLRHCLDEGDVRDHARAILKPMLTEEGTKRPRSVEQLTGDTRLDTNAVEGCLMQLNAWGLVRRINRAVNVAERVWEISHDFVARLLAQILSAPKRSRWQRVRPLLAPAALTAWLLTFVAVIPTLDKPSAATSATALMRAFPGATVTNSPTGHGYECTLKECSLKGRLNELRRRMRALGGVCKLVLTNQEDLSALSALPNPSGLRELQIEGCESLATLDDMRPMKNLSALAVRRCRQMQELSGLNELENLESLEIVSCPELTSVDVLGGLKTPHKLRIDLTDCSWLTDVKALTKLKGQLQEVKVPWAVPLAAYRELEQSLPGVKISRPPPDTVAKSLSESGRAKIKAAFDGRKKATNSIGMEFVLIPEGTFQMGSDKGEDYEKPIHDVAFRKPFYLGAYEVTQAQYQKVMGKTPPTFPGMDRPMEGVNWSDATAFCRKLSEIEGATYRLPTEAEWEYACRAGSTTRYCYGDDEKRLEEYAWFKDNSNQETHEVGQKKPNGWQLYDMHGNVWEWCNDWYGKYSADTQTDPEGPSIGMLRTLRGGSWYFLADYCRCAYRDGSPPGSRSRHNGFRVARPLP